MKTCRDIQLELAGFLDGDLRPEETAGIAAHLARCAECAGELEREQALRQSLGSAPPVRCPATVTTAILKAVAADSPKSAAPVRPPFRRRALAPAGVGIALAACLVALVTTRTPDVDPVHTPEATAIRSEPGPERVRQARRDLAWTLNLAARVIDHNEKETVKDVFGRKIPAAITGSLRSAAEASQGGKG
ncbi:zf-HC2 domain-containing protein [bacterium]|nr:zf-HC2 domain-containing protein [bacterium]